MKKVQVIKVGGGVLEDAAKRADFLQSFAQLEGPKILVHGGGRAATEWGNKLGVQAQMVDGRRITDDTYIDIVTMVYGGLVNKQLVAALQALGCHAFGLTGADANLILSEKRPVKNGIDFGWVGDPVSVQKDVLIDLLHKGITPVIAPLTHDGKGHLLNTNADTIAMVIAAALQSDYHVQLVYAFELAGVLEDVSNSDSLIRRIDADSFQRLKEDGKVFDGMIPKLENAFKAIRLGVSSVKIVKYDSLSQLDDAAFTAYTHIA
jgi:acetylglutamate kinase